MKREKVYVMGLILTLVLAGCSSNKNEAPIKREIVSGVTVARINPVQVDAYYETSGTVRAKTVSIVASRTMGTVTSVRVKEGDKVAAGEVLMTIDNRDTAQRVAATEAAFNEAQSAREAAGEQRSLAEVTFKRYKNLYDEKVISGQEFDQIEVRKKVADADFNRATQAVERAKANLEEARVYHGFAQVKAPISGIITEKKIEPGSMATVGIPLYTIEDTSQFKVEAALDERLMKKVSPGMTAYVLFNKTDEKLTGRITKVVPSIDTASRTFLIEITLQDKSLRTGSYGKILIPEGKKEALLIPVKSIVERGQLTGVFVVDDKGIITYRLIKAGKMYDGQAEVLSGLTKGESIIISGVEKAIEGGMVKTADSLKAVDSR
jgi:RND family efflux transporter MFP subunit